MVVRTESGARYTLVYDHDKHCLVGRREGWPEKLHCVAIRPELLPNLTATKTVDREGQYSCGYNARGTRTLRIIPKLVCKELILANRRGFRSTKIVDIIR